MRHRRHHSPSPAPSHRRLPAPRFSPAAAFAHHLRPPLAAVPSAASPSAAALARLRAPPFPSPPSARRVPPPSPAHFARAPRRLRPEPTYLALRRYNLITATRRAMLVLSCP